MSHPTREELADLLGDGLEGTATVRQHVDSCPGCQAELATIGAVPEILAAVPPAAMPADVAARLGAVIAEEVRRRSSGVDQREAEAEVAAAAARTALGTFGANLPFGDKIIGSRAVSQR